MLTQKKPARRKCAICREWFHPKFQNERWCCPEHGAKLALQLREKAVAKAEVKRKASASKADKAAKAELRKRKADLKPLRYWHKRAQQAFNAFIRARDSGKPCISCGRPDDGQHQRHASHYRSVGACSSLRYHQDNCWASCSICNNWLSGNVANYRLRLIDVIGLERVEWLESQPKVRHWSREELDEIEREYKEKTSSSRLLLREQS